MEHNRREEADASVHASIDLLLKTLDDQIAAAEKAIRQHIDNDPDLRQRRDLLTSIPGIADATSAWLLACVGDTRQFTDVRQLVAFVGLNPRLRESGTWKGHTRISKTGSPQLRAKLYFPAVVASQHNPVIRAFYDGLIRRGKPPMVAVVAAMRKLLHMVWGVLRSGTPFDPKITLAG
jgi:transposase